MITQFSQIDNPPSNDATSRLETDEKEVTHPNMALGPEDPNTIQVSASRGLLPSADSAVTVDADQ